ncbi:MAG TPA: VCBS repeat-containing protein, partial [Pyrinomonadaceae bacterium]|nr:VCBS repeat-containing protein [Pyrinomonadaceae bacterium]
MSEMKLRFSRWIFNLCVVCLVFGGVLFAWQTVGKLQSNNGEKPQKSNGETTAKTNDKAVSIHSAKRGNPFVNFKDGTDLISPNDANGAQPKNLTSADFDSDGIADFVTADVAGNLKFYRGNDVARRGEEQPFDLTEKNFALNISPDFLFAGDFNADGKSDILGATKGANYLAFLSGDGNGNFSQPSAIAINGQISALTIGEIGRKDGQTDVAVAISNKNGVFLLVFEHPESAFKHKPEIFKLSAPATEIAVGNLDEDFYADIAVASGNVLTIIHGRGQAYPWDLIPQSGITRPKAFVATRQMPFAISAMTVGRFGTKRGETLAILATDGNIYRLEPNRAEKPSNNQIKPEMLPRASRNLFLPTDAEVRNLAILNEPNISTQQAENGGKSLIDSNEISDGKFGEFLQKKQAEVAEKFKKMSQEERDKLLADALPKKTEYKEKAKQGYLRSISGKPSTLANWSIEMLVADLSLASAASSNVPNKMLKVNVSNSNLDDILLVDSTANQIRLISQTKTEDQNPKTEITNLEVENDVKAVLPMRLNLDALSDLVVLRSGASVPSVVMTEPMNIFFVTSDNEDGDCQGANLCSLRNAITLANETPGVDVIFVSTDIGLIAPLSPLPVITEGVTLAGQVNGNNQPLLEISGTNMSGQGVDGLKIRTSNAAIYNLAVNEFTSFYDPNTGSSFGGNGITIESTLGSPNNGNNYVSGNYLGTDKTGSLDKGNGAAGLNIFGADSNQIINNVISGNGSAQVRGVGISVTAGNSNIFHNNIIGLNSLGTGKLGNTQGLFLTGANNDFGGDGAGQGNTVSGNGEPYPSPSTACYGFGMTIPPLISLDTAELLTLNNNIKGNRFGTNPAGTVGLGNCEKALSTGPLTQTIIGSITQTGRNIFSDNGYDAVYCGEFVAILGNASEGGFGAISGNNIGTDIPGNIALPNDRRNQLPGFIFATGAAEIQNNLSFSNLGAPGGTTPNGACTGFCNLISGNDGNFYAAGATGYGTVAIFNNFVGLNKEGNQALPNTNTIGIASTSTFGETYVGIGVPNLTLGNVVAANGYANIDTGTGGALGGLFQSAYVHGNSIGTDSSGTFSVEIEPSGFNYGNTGVTASSGFGDTVSIGAGNFEARNVIAGLKGVQNGAGAGIEVFVSYGSIKILNNLIGLNRSLQPLGNLGGGMRIFGPFGANSVQIGGTDEEANQIAYNGSNGRNFAGVLINPGAQGITIRNNSIHDNFGLGIDLNSSGTFYEGDGVTPNDCQDADLGANGLQNYPVLYAPTQNGDGTLTVTGYLRSRRNQTFTLDFYRSQTADDSTYGEGAALIGSTTVSTDGNGFGEFSFTSALPVSTALAITATATDAQGNTSEFSCAAGVCASNLTEEARRLLEIQCSQPIEVNVESDEPDANTSDGVCDVDTETPNDLQCTLRAAIQEANARPGYNQIRFVIPGAGVHTISIGNNLPEINGNADLNATTQEGYTGTPQIKLDGGNKGGTGLKATGNSVTISGFAIVGFSEGINLRNAVGANVNKCHLGVNADGETFPTERMTDGIVIRDGGGANVIGG